MKIIVLLLISLQIMALDVPQLNRPVMDLANVVSKDKKQAVENKIINLYKHEEVQVSVLIINSLEDEKLEDYSIKVANTWGLGDKGKDNGVLILLAMKERKIRVEVGSGFEGYITDIEANRIIQEMVPYMRNKDVGGALLKAVEQVSYYADYNSPERKAERVLVEEQERLAYERRMQEREESVQKGIENLNFGAKIMIYLFALGFLVATFLLKPKKDLYLKKTEEVKERVQTAEEVKKNLNKKNKELVMDMNKYEFAQNLAGLKSLQKQRWNLESEIAKMKSYLGIE